MQMTIQTNSIWDGAYKIPWDDPDFSRRMLAEHLSQDHDLASRRDVWIDRQVAWIHEHPLEGRSSRILDLGCGPGLYSYRLAERGHRCRGIDFGPASIEHARRHNPAAERCEFRLDDIRRADYGGPYELAVILYGELNVFSPREISVILSRIHASLSPQGRLIVEVQIPEAVEAVGRGATSESVCERGLFSDRRHRCRTENQWLARQAVAVQTFTITELDGGQTRCYRSTTKAWSDAELVALMVEAGFATVAPEVGWPCDNPGLRLWQATAR